LSSVLTTVPPPPSDAVPLNPRRPRSTTRGRVTSRFELSKPPVTIQLRSRATSESTRSCARRTNPPPQIQIAYLGKAMFMQAKSLPVLDLHARRLQ
ncbi:hypothetical protein S245_071635, partial [Arachis hypogaea]